MKGFLARVAFVTKQAAAPSYVPGTSESGIGVGGLTLPAVARFAFTKAERYGASFAFGAAKGYYGPRFKRRGYGLDLWIGGGLTLLSAVLQIFTGGFSRLAPHLERVGDAGVQSYVNSWATGWGIARSGRPIVAQLPQLRGESVLGEIPPIGKGASFLTAEEFARASAPRT